jgi:exonuclease III
MKILLSLLYLSCFLSLLTDSSSHLPVPLGPVPFTIIHMYECPNLALCSINVNSLNIASANKPTQLRKIHGVVKLKTDVIFMSDTRLSNRNLVNCSADVSCIFLNNPYKSYTAFFNSTKNKRDVGILLSNDIDFSELGRVADPEENYLLVSLRISGKVFILGAVYGPNTYQPDFFINLERDIISLGNHPVIIGGDFNLTPSNLPVDINPDCFNMQAVPNVRHTNLLTEMCIRNNLIEPFRLLNPNLLSYSYQPRTAGSTLRSRIDFFIMSENLLRYCKECYIYDNLQSSLFDHKAVFLRISGSRVLRNRAPNISNKFIRDPDAEAIVDLAVKETFLIYQDRNHLEKNNLLLLIGRARKFIRDAGPDPDHYNITSPNPELRTLFKNQSENIRLSDEILNIVDTEVNIEWDIFFDMLLNHVKNKIISYQSYLFRYLSESKRQILENLKLLKLNYNDNFQEIQVLELRLQRISEQDIEFSLQQHPIYEHLNGEKMSPTFLKLAKDRNNDSKLSGVRDNNNLPFRSDEEREEYIVRFFENIYQVPANIPANFDGLIERFLGDDICNNPIVLGCKLTPEERARLEDDISIEELDNSVLGCKLLSAGGQDGFNNTFIKKFWPMFRKPLHNYMLSCFRKKALTNNFRTACIKLIPKKGDTASIKNWRPISLLSCFYKVISRAINNRLRTVNDKFTSRAQKGFTSSRQLQEVIINVTNSISFCRSEGITGALVSIDQAKAFDTIWHGFVRASYKFFGIGENFLDMMDTLGTGRSACILLDDNKYSRTFDLGTGRPQGDVPSPNQFNGGEQVLIFKIELDPGIASIYSQLQVPRNNFPVMREDEHLFFQEECNCETDNADGFADDVSAVTIYEFRSLNRLKVILVEFSAISGLHCNCDKTFVMIIGPDLPVTEEITSLGFRFVDEMTLLGFRINKSGLMVNEMFNELYRKIARIIIQWDRFRLSLPGRIGIYKTLLLSQLSFVGSIAMPDPETLDRLQNLMDNYARGTLKISKDRLYADPDQGGLGLINLKHFLIGLHSAWIKKAFISSRDNWRADLRNLSAGNCLTANPKFIDKDKFPVLNCLAESFNTFTEKFYNCNQNFRKAYIYNNALFRRNLRSELLIDQNFFSSNVPVLDLSRLSRLRFDDFL